MLFNLANILVFLLLGAGFVGMVLVLGWLIRPHTPDREKSLIYECGERPVRQAWFNFNPRFYLVALVFLIFDVEIAFTFPVLTVFKRWVGEGIGAVAFLEILVFIAVLGLGLVYVWRKGDLEWIRNLDGESASAPGRVTGGAQAPAAPVEASEKAA